MAGLGVSLLLLKKGLIRRSFTDYDEWEAKEIAAKGIDMNRAEPPTDWRLAIRRTILGVGVTVLASTAGYFVAQAIRQPVWSGVLAGLIVGPVIAGILSRWTIPMPAPVGEPATIAPDLWIAYPHARRESLKEFVFLSPPVCLGALAGWLAMKGLGDQALPLWLAALTGSLMGYLLGGLLVWAVRIGGTLAFDKDAMGLGDVHMVAGIGACLGWIDASLAFFGAAFVGLYWWMAQRAWTGKGGRAMPYGPFIAVATVLVILAHPLIEIGLNRLLPPGPGQMPIQLP